MKNLYSPDNGHAAIAFVTSKKVAETEISKKIINDTISIVRKDLQIDPKIYHFNSSYYFDEWVYNQKENLKTENLLFGIQINDQTNESFISLTYLYNGTTKSDDKVFSQVQRILYKRLHDDSSADFQYTIRPVTSHTAGEIVSSIVPIFVTFGLINICILYLTQAIEDMSGEKRPYMILCSMKLSSYWFGCFIVDFFEWLFFVTFFWSVYSLFQTPLFSENKIDSYLALVLSGPGFILISYCISFIFNSPETGANYALILLIILFAIFSTQDLTPNAKFNKLLALIGQIYPPSNLFSILSELSQGKFSLHHSFPSFLCTYLFYSLFLCFIEWTITFSEESNTNIEFRKYTNFFKESKIKEIDPESVRRMEEIVFLEEKERNTTNNFILKAKNVSRLYFSNRKPIPAVNDLTLGVKEGTTLGLLGANGSGKTTLMKMILKRIPQSFGKIETLKSSSASDSKNAISYCPQYDDHLSPELTAKENLKFYGILFGLENNIIEERSNQLIQILDINRNKKPKNDNLQNNSQQSNNHLLNQTQTNENDNNKLLKNMSGGTKRKVAVAVALMSGSPIVILDEPTSSLDSSARKKVHNLIRKMQQSRLSTFILCTHLLNEADSLCDEIAVMINGSICAFGAPRELTEKFGLNWNIKVHLIDDSNHDNLENGGMYCKTKENLSDFMKKKFSEDAKLMLDQKKEQTYIVPNHSIKLKEVFGIMKEAKEQIPGISHYTCSSSTLETVFMDILKKYEP